MAPRKKETDETLKRVAKELSQMDMGKLQQTREMIDGCIAEIMPTFRDACVKHSAFIMAVTLRKIGMALALEAPNAEAEKKVVSLLIGGWAQEYQLKRNVREAEATQSDKQSADGENAKGN